MGGECGETARVVDSGKAPIFVEHQAERVVQDRAVVEHTRRHGELGQPGGPQGILVEVPVPEQQVLDGGEDGATPVTGTFNITINLVNDNSTTAVADNDGSSEVVLENASVGTTIGVTAFASDADTGDTISYSLVDDDGGNHEVVLTAIRGETAELSIGGVKVSHPVAEISQSWFGQYMLLWRPPGGAAVSMGPGTRGPAVLWLRESLATISSDYATDATDSDVFDDGLERMVRNFQRDHRLDVDGLAGQQTQIIINSLLGTKDTPRLTTPRLAQD